MEFGFRGPSYTVAAACVAGAQAVANGFQAIASGGVRRALVGGVDVTLVPGAFTAWCRLGLLSRRNHDPQGASAPFSADRDGLVLADGAAVLTLERLDDARDRGARVYAELAGAGLACRAPNLTAVSVEGEVEGLQRALADAGLAPGEVGYVNAHGSSTRQNDAVEARALNAVFGPGPGRPAVSSTKSALGHAMGASGAIECAITALALRDQVLPPSLNLRERDPECDLDVVTGAARATEVWAALSSSFAFGGSVVVLALRRA
jgi:3-oxoacyl-(acyl-carrier-protein) synthase